MLTRVGRRVSTFVARVPTRRTAVATKARLCFTAAAYVPKNRKFENAFLLSGVIFISNVVQTTDKPAAPLEVLRRRVRWRLFERGMRETEIIFRSFWHHNVDKLTEDELKQLEKLSDELDPDLYKWFTGAMETPQDIKAMPMWAQLVQHMKDISLKDEWSIRNRSSHTNPAFS